MCKPTIKEVSRINETLKKHHLKKMKKGPVMSEEKEAKKFYKVKSVLDEKSKDDYYLRPHGNRATIAMVNLLQSDIIITTEKMSELGFGALKIGRVLATGADFHNIDIGDYVAINENVAVQHRSCLNIIKGHEWEGLELVTITGDQIQEVLKTPEGVDFELYDERKKQDELDEARRIARERLIQP